MISILKRERGVTILLLAITLLLISTLFILFSARFGILLQKISANTYKNQQAFEAGEAGIEAAIPYLQDNYTAIVSTATGGYLQPYLNSSTQHVALANGSQYSFTYSNPIINNYQLITITSTGTNADGSATRTLTQQVQVYSWMSAPTVSLTTQGDVALSNNASINNTETNNNINAGKDVSFNNASHTTTSSGITSNSSQTGSDVTQNNSAIANLSTDQFFQNIFGAAQSTVQSQANYVFTNSKDTSYSSLNGVSGAIIWINQTENSTATFNNLTVLGSPTKPVILIVSGNLKIMNNVTIFGLVFVMNSSEDTTLSNFTNINGAIASTGDINLKNNAALTYNSSLLNNAPAAGGPPHFAKIPSSWKDF